MSDGAPESPRLAALRQQAEAGDLKAVADFWQEVEAHGTPMIEPIEGDDAHTLVTFLWRETGPIENVVVMGGIAGFGIDDGQMSRVPGTNVWYYTCRVRNDLRTTYRIAINVGEHQSGHWMLDPLNPRVYVNARIPDEGEEHDSGFTDSALELPGAPPQVWLEPREVEHGQVEMHRAGSAILDNQRRVWVYLPAGYSAEAEPYPLLLVTDGETYVQFAPTALDNLIAAGEIPPLVAVMVANPTGDIGARLTELACSEPFAAFIAEELVPWARGLFNVSVDPARTIIAGASLGGLTAAFLGLRHPELFGNVLTQSGSFWWRPSDDEEHVWLARQYVAAPHLPLRFYQEIGVLESGGTPGNGPSQLFSNRHLRDVLLAKGYDVTYSEYGGGHSFLAWQGSVADGLIALLGTNRAD